MVVLSAIGVKIPNAGDIAQCCSQVREKGLPLRLTAPPLPVVALTTHSHRAASLEPRTRPPTTLHCLSTHWRRHPVVSPESGRPVTLKVLWGWRELGARDQEHGWAVSERLELRQGPACLWGWKSAHWARGPEGLKGGRRLGGLWS